LWWQACDPSASCPSGTSKPYRLRARRISHAKIMPIADGPFENARAKHGSRCGSRCSPAARERGNSVPIRETRVPPLRLGGQRTFLAGRAFYPLVSQLQSSFRSREVTVACRHATPEERRMDQPPRVPVTEPLIGRSSRRKLLQTEWAPSGLRTVSVPTPRRPFLEITWSGVLTNSAPLADPRSPQASRSARRHFARARDP